MIVEVVIQAIKSLVFFFIGIWKRALCCFRRRRRLSCDSVPLTAVGVVSDYPGPSSSTTGNEMENWDWQEHNTNFKPNSIQEHIEFYRQQKKKLSTRAQTPTEEEVQQDFFEDMTPRITKQTKLFINNDDETAKVNSPHLSLAPQPLVTPVGELGEWEDTPGWEEQTNPDYDPQTILREKRRQERERRIWEQQQKRQDKVIRPILGAKIS